MPRRSTRSVFSSFWRVHNLIHHSYKSNRETHESKKRRSVRIREQKQKQAEQAKKKVEKKIQVQKHTPTINFVYVGNVTRGYLSAFPRLTSRSCYQERRPIRSNLSLVNLAPSPRLSSAVVEERLAE